MYHSPLRQLVSDSCERGPRPLVHLRVVPSPSTVGCAAPNCALCGSAPMDLKYLYGKVLCNPSL